MLSRVKKILQYHCRGLLNDTNVDRVSTFKLVGVLISKWLETDTATVSPNGRRLHRGCISWDWNVPERLPAIWSVSAAQSSVYMRVQSGIPAWRRVSVHFDVRFWNHCRNERRTLILLATVLKHR